MQLQDLDPPVGTRIKVYFKTGVIEEGVTLFWSPTRSAIKSLSSDNVFVIMNTEELVYGYKIIYEELEVKNIYVEPPKVDPIAREPEELRTKRLVELQQMRTIMEKQKARESMNTFIAEDRMSERVNTYQPIRKLRKPPL